MVNLGCGLGLLLLIFLIFISYCQLALYHEQHLSYRPKQESCSRIIADDLIAQHPTFLESIQEVRRQKAQGQVRRLADLRQKYSEE